MMEQLDLGLQTELLLVSFQRTAPEEPLVGWLPLVHLCKRWLCMHCPGSHLHGDYDFWCDH